MPVWRSSGSNNSRMEQEQGYASYQQSLTSRQSPKWPNYTLQRIPKNKVHTLIGGIWLSYNVLFVFDFADLFEGKTNNQN